MDTKVTVVGRAIKAEVDAEGDRGPCRVLLAAIEADLMERKRRSQFTATIRAVTGAVSAYLVGRLGLQLLKDLERLLLCRKGAHLDYWAVIG